MVNNFVRGANRFSRRANNFAVCSIFGQYSSFFINDPIKRVRIRPKILVGVQVLFEMHTYC